MIRFPVQGTPKGQPRPRAFARPMGGGKWAARVYDAGTAEGWKSAIAEAVRPMLPAEPWEGPIRVDAVFLMPRPKSHYRTGRRAGELRDDAPPLHVYVPDADNMAKAVLDALTRVGLWRDDGQACEVHASKRYGERPGAEVAVSRIERGEMSEVERLREALQLIAENGGKTVAHDEHDGLPPTNCDGYWCADQALEALEGAGQ